MVGRKKTGLAVLAIALLCAAQSDSIAGGKIAGKTKKAAQEKPSKRRFRQRATAAFWRITEASLDRAGSVAAKLRKARPFVYPRHGVVAFDSATGAVHGSTGGAFVANNSLRGIAPRGAASFHAPPIEGTRVTYQVGDGPAKVSGKTDGRGFIKVEPILRSQLKKLNPRRGGLLKVKLKANESEAQQRILALPRDYAGPIFISDVNLTLREVSSAGAAMGKRYRPIKGTDKLLSEVARRGVPIIYLSGGFEAEGAWNETFIKQFPAGPLFIRPSASMQEIGSKAMADANMGSFKAEKIAELKRLFPKAKWIGLGDDKHEDAFVYTKAGFGERAFIRHSYADGMNVPRDFRGAIARDGRFTAAFQRKVLAAVDAAIGK